MTNLASAHESPLQAAQSALTLLGARVQRNFFDDIEGIDTLDIGLDKLTLALSELFELPETERTTIDDVITYLIFRDELAHEALDEVMALREGIQKATYHGLTDKALEETERARRALYEHIEALLGKIEKAQTSAEGQRDG